MSATSFDLGPIWKVVLLAVLQGITEFLPVSSSGHLVLAKRWMGLDSPGAALEVALHLGTLVSILVFYRRRLASLAVDFLRGAGVSRAYAGWVVAASVPAVAVHLAAGRQIEALFDGYGAVVAALALNGLLLLSSRLEPRREGGLGWRSAIAMGLGQAVALVPGISRSGSTIMAARRLGVPPEQAAEFSLLMVVPLLLGAAVLKLAHFRAGEMGDVTLAQAALGATVAAFVGYGAITLLVRLLARGAFWMFGLYCLAAAGVGFALRGVTGS